MYNKKTKDSNILRTEDIEGTKPKRGGFERHPDAFTKMVEPRLDTYSVVALSSPRYSRLTSLRTKNLDHYHMMMRNLPGGVEKFEKLMRDQSRSPPIHSTTLQTEAVQPIEKSSTSLKPLHFNPNTRKRANNKKNHDSDKAAFGDFDQANRDILEWKTDNRNYGSEELAAIEKPIARNYNNPALTTNSRSTPHSLSFRRPRNRPQFFASASSGTFSVPQSADEPHSH